MLNRCKNWFLEKSVMTQTLFTPGVNRRGLEVIEYVLIAAVVIVAVAAGFALIGGSLKTKISQICSSLGIGTGC